MRGEPCPQLWAGRRNQRAPIFQTLAATTPALAARVKNLKSVMGHKI